MKKETLYISLLFCAAFISLASAEVGEVKIELPENKKEVKMENNNKNVTEEYIFDKGVKVPNDYFTGDVMLNMLVVDKEQVYDTQAYDVKFSAKARTYWHSHPGGQLLFITKGKGYYQEKGRPARVLQKGDVVEIPIDVVHWHGAAADSEFVHLGVTSRSDKGPAKWFGEVTDEEYNSAINGN